MDVLTQGAVPELLPGIERGNKEELVQDSV